MYVEGGRPARNEAWRRKLALGAKAGDREAASARLFGMAPETLALVLVAVWIASAVVSGWWASQKARSVKRWTVFGLIAGPLSLIAHRFYPSRYIPDTMACPGCGRPISRRAVACHHCQHRIPAMDVLITRMPSDPDARRTVLNELAREYGIPYDEAGRKAEALPVAGYRHIAPDQVDEFVQRLEKAGAGVSVVPAK